MKLRFTTIDIRASIAELRQRLTGLRVVNIYDIDNKTYLIKFSKPDLKMMLLFESGSRIHGTEFDWPKGMTPSGFSMKLRKHLRGRRLESIGQVGADRIVDMQFGSGPAAYHVIVELYDRGNVVLTDFEYVILNVLRPRTDESQDVRFAVRETYPLQTARQPDGPITTQRLLSILETSKEGDQLKKLLNPHLVYGAAMIEHCMQMAGLPENARLGKEFDIQQDVPQLLTALQDAERMLQLSETGTCKGYILQKSEKKPQLVSGDASGDLLTYAEFHPFLYKQHENSIYKEFETFDKAADEFFSNIGSQKLDMKALQQERAAVKKLENVKRDHEKRIGSLQEEQERDVVKARLIEANQRLVDQAIRVVQSALANQIDWTQIEQIVSEARQKGDPVATSIRGLKLDTNLITLWLTDTHVEDFSHDEEEEEDDDSDDVMKPMKVDIDLSLSAHSNAKRYYGMKRHAAEKQQKTVDASTKALKSAERKTKQTLKDVQTAVSIRKARRVYWFEKFLWFISSENYLVIGGRDQQQNELIVKKHLRPGDVYVHADLHGASSVIVKNPSGEPVAPKTLNEAGTMAICHSAAWDAKVVTSAWWVKHDQVSKTAPTGEYLTTGSFMVRGKKNYLPPSYLIYGFGFLFKLDDSCLLHHKDERRVRLAEDEDVASSSSAPTPGGAMDVIEEAEGESEEELRDPGGGDGEEEEQEQEEGETTGEKKEPMTKAVKIEDAEEGEKSSEDEVGGRDEEKTARPQEGRSSEDPTIVFPDTSIQLQHVGGNKYALHGTVEAADGDGSASVPDGMEEERESAADVCSQKVSGSGRISAKQKRDLKKKAKFGSLPEREAAGMMTGKRTGDEGKSKENELETEQACSVSETDPAEEQVDVQPSQVPLKRRQKSKLKKIKDKYRDQDDEERKLRMEILASAGVEKVTRTKKDKKNKPRNQPATNRKPSPLQPQPGEEQGKQGEGQGQGQPPQQGSGGRPRRALTIDDIKLETLTVEDAGGGERREEEAATATRVEDEDQLSDDDKDKTPAVEDVDTLDSLTGIPVVDDELLFCVAVAAPYNALLAYKYKVKLTPGSTKRGKAAKTAINTFAHDRSSTPREKDLFRSLKDVDFSRNIPGKVKVSAPHLHKQKHK